MQAYHRATSVPDGGLELMLGGYTIRVTAGTDLSLLASVLQVIRHAE